MNYSQYLNGGEEAQQQDGAMQELVDLVSRALNQEDAEAGEQLRILLENAPELEEIVVRIAESLQSESTPSMKCGGKTSKKQLGGITKKAKKAECGCMLKKVGGRLIEVDGCTGLPIHKKGNKIKKYEDPATPVEAEPVQPAASVGAEPVQPVVPVVPQKKNSELLQAGIANYEALTLEEKTRFNALVAQMNQQYNPITTPTTSYTFKGNTYDSLDAANQAYATDAGVINAQKARNQAIKQSLGFTPRSNYYKQIVDAATAYEDGADLMNRSTFMNTMKNPGADGTAGQFNNLTGRQRRRAWRLYKGINASGAFDQNPMPTRPQEVTTQTPPQEINIDWGATAI